MFINQLWEQDDRSWNWLQTRLPALSWGFRGLRLQEKQLEEKNFPFLKNFLLLTQWLLFHSEYLVTSHKGNSRTYSHGLPW